MRNLRAVILISAFILGPGCSPQTRDTIVGPTALAEPSYRAIAVSGPSAATFPPRNEPFLFRTNLEAKYRDGLRREPTSSYVDIEGTIVWTQEYLRYRVNQCSHPEAVSRVFRQIDGLGVDAVCGSTSTAAFPPRNEPFDFRVQLEQKYRDGLRRSPTLTFVDAEGDIVWTLEYLRYRLSSCEHADAESKVFAQIDDRSRIPQDCTPGTRRTETFAFTLPARSTAQLQLGPVRAGSGPLEATLSYAGDFVLATWICTPDTAIPCQAMCAPCQLGGRPITRAFNISRHFPAGLIRAVVWFNPNYPQPPGAASGTVTFTYNNP